MPGNVAPPVPAAFSGQVVRGRLCRVGDMTKHGRIHFCPNYRHGVPLTRISVWLALFYHCSAIVERFAIPICARHELPARRRAEVNAPLSTKRPAHHLPSKVGRTGGEETAL